MPRETRWCHPWGAADGSQLHPDSESEAIVWIFWAPQSHQVTLRSGAPTAHPFFHLTRAEKEVAEDSAFGPGLETWENFGGRDFANQKSVRA